MTLKPLTAALAAILLALPAAAQDSERQSGPVFTEFGHWTPIESMQPADPAMDYKAIFDAVQGSKDGKANWRFDSAARYVNLLVDGGVPVENVKIALVVHGSASWDVTTDAAYARKYPGQTNPNRAVVLEMIDKGAEFYICGQAAAYHGIAAEDLLPGVKMSLSQTVATTILHNRGYTNIP